MGIEENNKKQPTSADPALNPMYIWATVQLNSLHELKCELFRYWIGSFFILFKAILNFVEICLEKAARIVLNFISKSRTPASSRLYVEVDTGV